MNFKQFIKNYIKIILIVLIPLLLMPIPIILNGKESKGGFIILVISLYWATECLPIGVTALLPIILFPLFGIVTTKDLTPIYFQEINVLLFGGLVVSGAIEITGLHERISLRALIFFGSSPKWILLGLMLITAFLSLWINNSATCSLMLPITNAILEQLVLNDKIFHAENPSSLSASTAPIQLDPVEENGENIENAEAQSGIQKSEIVLSDRENFHQIVSKSKKARNLVTCYLLSCSYSSTMGGLGSLVGTTPNILFKGYFDDKYPKFSLGFLNFGMFALPVSVLLIFTTWIFLSFRFLPKEYLFSCSKKYTKNRNTSLQKLIKEKYEHLGKIRFDQICVGIVFVILVVLWLTRDIPGFVGWKDLFDSKFVSDTTPAVVAVILLFIFPKKNIFKGEKYEHLLSWKEIEYNLPWNVILLIGGGLAIAEGFQKSGLSNLIGDLLKNVVLEKKEITLMIIILFGAVATEFTSNLSMATILLPIVDRLAIESRISPIYLLFPLILSVSLAFMLPVATPTNAIVFSNGFVKMKDMITTGFFINLFGLLTVFLAANTWLGLVFNLDAITSPSNITNNKYFNEKIIVFLH